MHQAILRWTALALFCIATPALAAYPEKPIRIIVPFGAGGGTDVIARVVADHLGRTMGTVIVENKPGAGGTIGSDAAAKSRPDGYTLLLGTNATMALAPGLYRRLPYDPVKSFVPVASLAEAPSILVVHPTVPAKDVKSFINYLMANPGKLNYGSAGNGSTAHVATAALSRATQTEAVHIPFKGGAAAIQELMSGRLQFMISFPVETLPLLKADRLRALAVTSTSRYSELPELPTLNEAGAPGYEMTNWFGLFAPAGTPDKIVEMLAKKANEALAEPSIIEAFSKQGVYPAPMTRDAFQEFTRREVGRWMEEVRALDISLD